MASKLFTLADKTVTAAGTAEQITTTPTPVATVILQALESNTNPVFVGDSDVSSTRKAATLDAGECFEITGADINGTPDDLILSDIYVDVTTNGEGVSIGYIKRR